MNAIYEIKWVNGDGGPMAGSSIRIAAVANGMTFKHLTSEQMGDVLAGPENTPAQEPQ